MIILETAENWLLSLSDVVPVEVFIFGGSFIEEVLAPIPSPLIMTLGGTLAAAKGMGVMGMLFLALLGAIGKTLASVVVYFVSDKAEDVILGRFGRFIGVSNEDVEKIGGQFRGSNRDTVILFLARAIPVMPTAPVSIVCGIIKLEMKSFLIGTFFGTFVRNIQYLALGFFGLGSLEAINSGLDSMESVVQVVLAAVGGALILLLYYRRKSDTNLLATIKSWFGMK